MNKAARNGSDRRRVSRGGILAPRVREMLLAVPAMAAIVLAFFFLFVRTPDENELTGSVTAGGWPVVYGTVTVVASDDRVYTAPIRADGTYRIPSVPPGTVRVAVSSPNPRSIVERMGAADAAAAGASAPITASGARDTAATGPANGPGDAGGASAASGAETAVRKPTAVQEDAAAGNVSVAAPNGTAAPFPAPVSPHSRGQDRQQGWFRIPGRYASPATSGIRTEVRRGRTPLDIRLD